MAIFRPGQRHRYSRILGRGGGKRDVAAVLSLTAMVDMFTVLVVFLLQNFDQVLFIPDDVQLPKAQQIKELKPAVVVTISEKEILIDKTTVISFKDLQAQEEWMVEPLRGKVEEALKVSKVKYEQSLKKRLQNAVDKARGEKEEDPNSWNKVTIQADKGIDYLSVKKVMYTVTEAGAGEINFAVIKEKSQQ